MCFNWIPTCHYDLAIYVQRNLVGVICPQTRNNQGSRHWQYGCISALEDYVVLLTQLRGRFLTSATCHRLSDKEHVAQWCGLQNALAGYRLILHGYGLVSVVDVSCSYWEQEISRGDDSPSLSGLSYSHWKSAKCSVHPINYCLVSTVCL